LKGLAFKRGPAAFIKHILTGNLEGIIEIYQYQIRPIAFAYESSLIDVKAGSNIMGGLFDDLF
jgi:hypothetical protein